MEPSKDPISVRVGRINAQLLGKPQLSKEYWSLLTREGLLDALQVLYDECNTDYLRNIDKNVRKFVEKNRKSLTELKRQRVNLADFEVKKVIGRGHFGEVHVVKEKQTGDVYAMKTIKKYQSLEQKNASFDVERNIMAFANSPWLTYLQYAFQDSQNLYFVMEYHPGGDLLGLLYRQGGTLPESAITFYVAELVVGLNDLHTMGYVHRDIKPDNILLDRCGHLKIVDFGSATKLNSEGAMTDVLPVGTPDYIAPELLQSLDNKNQRTNYGISCDYWSLGILAYELTVGNTPFNGQNTSSVYSKIMNYRNNLKFPPDVVLSQAFVSLVKGLLTEQSSRLVYSDIRMHPLFENVDFDSLRDQVPPYVPKIVSVDDTSNFTDIQRKKNQPHIDNFKTKTQFSGKNLPFIGFTFTHNEYNDCGESSGSTVAVEDETVRSLKKQIDALQRKLQKTADSFQEKGSLERKYEEKARKLESLESVRDRLEHDLADSMAENSALKRRLDLERKDRSELEQKTLEIVRAAKLKWATSEKMKLDIVQKQVEEYKEKAKKLQLANGNLEKEFLKMNEYREKLRDNHKESLEKVEELRRNSLISLESRLECITVQTQGEIAELRAKILAGVNEKMQLNAQVLGLEKEKENLKTELLVTAKKCDDFHDLFEQSQKIIKDKDDIICRLKEENANIEKYKEELRKLESLMQILEDNAKQKVEHEGALKEERDVCKQLNQEVEDLKTDITFEKLSHQAVLEEQAKKHKSEIRDLEEQIKHALNQNGELEIRLKEAELNDQTNSVKVRNLESLLIQLQNGVSKLETSSDRESVLQEQVKRLEQQLGEVHEGLALEKQELSQFKSKYWRMEKDLQNAELDKKIVERDLKELKQENNRLTVEMKTLSEKMGESKKVHERALFELNGINENLAVEVYKLKDLIVNLEDKLYHEREKVNNEKNYISRLKDEIYNSEKKISSLVKELESAKSQVAVAEKQIVDYEKNNSNLVLRLEGIVKEKADLLGTVENYKREQQNNQLNRQALREACTILERQLGEYENLCSTYQSKRQSLQTEVDKLTKDLQQAKEDVLDARRSTNEEKSFKLLAEAKSKRMQEDFEALSEECESCKNQCTEFKEFCNVLSDQLSLAEQKIKNLEISLKANARQMENFKSEHCMLKEEISVQLTNLNKFKESNYQLNKCFNEAKANNDMQKELVNKLRNCLSEKEAYSKERELKFEATILQQTKLIDFLQSKIEEGNKKKKTLTDKLFGHSKKENQPPLSIVFNYRDLEVQLNKEKEITKSLRQEILKLKSELYSSSEIEVAKSPVLNVNEQKRVFEHIVQSPASQKNDLYRQNSVQRMHHNIPHRFESKLCTKTTKCAQCNNQILLGRSSSMCRECGVVVHPNCVVALPRTCGLPQAFAKHYSESLTKLENSKNKYEKQRTSEESIDVEGWVKIPMKGCWDKYYACLTSSALCFYKKPPNQPEVELVESLELNSPDSHGKVTLEPLGSEVGIPVANSDLPFVMKVEVSPNTTCWPPKCLIFMTLSIEDKEKWYKALQNIFTPDTEKYSGKRIFTLNEEIEVNCLVELSNSAKLLGTEKGLHSYTNDILLHIAGPLRIHQIALLPTVNLALMIVDETRVLISCDLKHLTSLTQCAPCTKPTLLFKTVNLRNLGGFHIFQTSDFVKRHMMCVATARQLVITSYHYVSQEFIVERILDTAEPTSCILFTEYTLIIGADKFFEIDLGNYEADEFLDVSDIKLSHVIKCYRMKSFPLAIVQISNQPIEYLLCFNEFATFVDEFGRSTRSCDIKWTHLPHAFYYHNNYLYVCQFCGVEILKVSALKCRDSCDTILLVNVDSFKIEVDSLKYLGSSKNGMYVQSGTDVKFISSSALQSDEVSLSSEIISEHTEDNDADDDCDRFSFSSSIVRSLDDYSSDNESVSAGTDTHKRVKFAITTDL